MHIYHSDSTPSSVDVSFESTPPNLVVSIVGWAQSLESLKSQDNFRVHRYDADQKPSKG